MENNNSPLKTIPQLVEKNNVLIDRVDKMMTLTAQLLKDRQTAEIPPEEIDKLKEVIKTTPCAPPNTEQLCTKIANGVVADVREDVKEAVEETIRSMKVRLEHTHYYCKPEDAWNLMREDFRRCFLFISVLCLLLALTLGGFLIWYNDSEAYWSKQYLDIVRSEYITESEKKALKEEIFSTGLLPKEFDSNPELIKEKIRRNKTIIKGRKKQAVKNAGKFKTNPAIEK